MATRLRCPRCASSKYWILKDRRRRCARCRLDWRPWRMPLRLSSQQWKELLGWFERGLTSDQIARETGFNRKQVLRALTVVRRSLARTIPPAYRALAELMDGMGREMGFDRKRMLRALPVLRRSLPQAPKFLGEVGIEEGFWIYLRERLGAKGGIRRQRFRLFLAEYIWRYNHQNLSIKQRINELIKLVKQRNYPS